jgi:hypothetical protein
MSKQGNQSSSSNPAAGAIATEAGFLNLKYEPAYNGTAAASARDLIEKVSRHCFQSGTVR